MAFTSMTAPPNNCEIENSKNLTIDLIKEFEGFKSHAYKDNGRYSIGYGTKASHPKEVISVQEAERRLIETYEKTFLNLIKRYDIQDESTAIVLTSLYYNVGKLGTTLSNAIKYDDRYTIVQVLPRYCKASGIELKGLKRRRYSELKLLCSIWEQSDELIPNGVDEL